MKKQKIIKINLFSLISKNIATRQAIDLVKERIFTQNLENTIVELNFTKVNFISRSFADELINLRKQLMIKNILVNFVNTNKEINTILKIVSIQKANKKVREINLSNLAVKNLEKIVYQF